MSLLWNRIRVLLKGQKSRFHNNKRFGLSKDVSLCVKTLGRFFVCKNESLFPSTTKQPQSGGCEIKRCPQFHAGAQPTTIQSGIRME